MSVCVTGVYVHECVCVTCVDVHECVYVGHVSVCACVCMALCVCVPGLQIVSLLTAKGIETVTDAKRGFGVLTLTLS